MMHSGMTIEDQHIFFDDDGSIAMLPIFKKKELTPPKKNSEASR